MKYLKWILANGCITLGISVLIFKILDWFNPFMNFMGYSEWALYLLCAFAILMGIFYAIPTKNRKGA